MDVELELLGLELDGVMDEGKVWRGLDEAWNEMQLRRAEEVELD